MVFYGFLFGGILFIMIAEFFGVRKVLKEEGHKIKGQSHGDFI